ncbi:MAG: hypothetical protein QW046_05805 [Candidatus Micrarchaeaceae archaeon]
MRIRINTLFHIHILRKREISASFIYDIMLKKEIEFEFERATKNTFRFQERASGNPDIGTLYVQKSLFEGKEPKSLKLTVEWE